jgi:hypothetical protein
MVKYMQDATKLTFVYLDIIYVHGFLILTSIPLSLPFLFCPNLDQGRIGRVIEGGKIILTGFRRCRGIGILLAQTMY